MINRLAVATASVLATLLATPVFAAGPTLDSATIDIRPDTGGNASVTEDITLSGVASGAKVDNLLATFTGVSVDGLSIEMDGSPVQFSTKTVSGLKHLSFVANSARTLSYKVTYSTHSTGTSNVPLVVPAATPTKHRPVKLTYEVPTGSYLQGDPFPIATSDSGTIRQSLDAVPSFVDYTLGSSPPSIFTASNIYSALVILVITVFVVVWIVNERRTMARRAVGV